MRIISNFYDYYDSVSKAILDKDDRIVFHRTRQEIVLEEKFPLYIPPVPGVRIIVVIFCGKAYPIRLEFPWGSDGADLDISRFNDWTIFDRPETYYSGKDNGWYERYKHKDWNALNKEHKSPIVMYENFGWKSQVLTINPLLKDVFFQKIFSPWEAYQEIEKWVETHLINVGKVTEVGNSDKISKAGFDLITSFRKM